MCGINGFNFSNKKLALAMNKAIKHRGPDDSGTYFDQKISLGHVRLSIQDLSTKGSQPLFYSKKRGACNNKFNSENITTSDLSIVFNGEIYNFLELKEELLSKGYSFTTGTDTEVILASYLEHGFDCVKKFNGMWSFCIYDKKKEIFFCSRDRLGVKPFYYYLKDEKFVFSSEIKGILAHKELKLNRTKNIDKDSVNYYFSLGYIPSPFSIFKNCYKLEAGHNLVFNIKTKEVTKTKYWSLPDFNPITDKKKLILKGRELLLDAVRIRMISDVPVGAFLSGGLDSSSVVGYMTKFTSSKKLHTFSIGFEGKYDETKYINIVKDAFKTEHHHFYFKKKDFEKLIESYSYHYDEPFSDYSGFPTTKVSEIAKKHVSVALSGDGGDEIFGGYNLHKMGKRLDLIYKLPRFIRLVLSKTPIKENLNSLASFYLLKEAFKLSLNPKFQFYSKSLVKNRPISPLYVSLVEKRMKYSIKKGDGSLSEGLRIYDLLFNTLADNFLVKVDRASMKHALEVRSPFLDYRFAEFSQQIPSKYKVSVNETKKLMKEIIKDIVPKKIVYRKKQGFEPPIDKWILDKKHEKDLKRGLALIKELDEFSYNFYNNKVFKEKNKLYATYKIRLFLFKKWWDTWINYTS